MRPSLRFLAVAIVGWAALRAATLGALPGAELFTIEPSEAKVPPIAATQFPAIDPVEPSGGDVVTAPMEAAAYPYYGPYASAPVRPIVVPIYPGGPAAQGPSPAPATLTTILPEPRPRFYSDVPVLDQWPLSRIAAASMPPLRSTVIAPAQSLPVALGKHKLDRLQFTTWALLRSQQTGVAGSQSLAAGGSLGASQAGARLTYAFTRRIAASFRSSTAVGRRGGEIAGGLRVQPVGGIPVWLTAERRQRIGREGGGRNAFALFFEAGVYERPMPFRFLLDTYLEGGVVGLRSRDKFIDGALTLTRPVYRNFSAGFGVWGGAQPGLYRVDAGPRVTMRVRRNIRVHFDWRQRLAGTANPGSGPAVTLAGDF